ncbi:voltage-dependent calcium channel gamma-like subunit [Ictalurus furcatus]|uniref:voltage-dependent calcium channel gamma-like subunit n=1 Tax=Ictalurus furcatus TaxID=66913 RepID=UPI0023509036|nr:voltage-dependent calcium channel gamma-like subunit [Ictalurus furcatus]
MSLDWGRKRREHANSMHTRRRCDKCDVTKERTTRIGSEALAPAAQEKSHPFFLEVLCRTLIILCMALSIVLSSMAVCDGYWLLTEQRMFGLWFFCEVDTENSGAPPNCSRHIGEEIGQLLEHGLWLCRCVASVAVVSAIFGLELLVLSQVTEGQASRQRWHLGAWLVLLAAVLAAAGVMMFVFLLWDYATPLAFTLTFWCQFNATFLFFLNGMAAWHIPNMAYFLPSSGDLGKP